MPPTTTKTLSPAELAKLEHAFASDPGSEAYRPLAEAYLGMGRFMEAMVVCKKGVKAHPNTPHPRLLLSKVYAEQGKDKKALEEALAALLVAPADKIALRTTGALQVKTGELDAGKANLLKAFEADPSDSDTLDAMRTHKVELPRKDPPPPPPAPVAPPAPVHAASPPTNGTPVGASMQQAGPAAHHPQHAPQQQARPGGGPPPRPQQKAQGRPQAFGGNDSAEVSSEISAVGLQPYKKPSNARTITLALVILVPLIVGGKLIYGVWNAKRVRAVNSLLTQIRDQVHKDSFDGYQKACKLGEEALDIDPGRSEVHAYLALAYAIRAGEHGGGEEARKAAETHLSEVKDKEAAGLNQRIAASALLKFYGGKRAEAAKELDDKLKDIDPDANKASLLWMTLGMIQTEMGNLEVAKDSLEKAQRISSTDARVYAALGNLNRRRGNEQEAVRNFDTALKYERGHPDSMLGTALLVLNLDEPGLGYGTAAKSLKGMIDAQPPNSPRQEALALMGRSLLYSRVANDLPLYKDVKFKAELEEKTGILEKERDKNLKEVAKAEDAAFSKDRANPELNLLKGKRLLFEGKVNEAADEIHKAIAADATRAHFHVELAKALMRKEGGDKEAEDALRKALTLVPESPKLMTLLGTALLRQKRVDDAIAAFERAVKDNARNGEARFSLGRLYRDDKKEYVKANDNFERAAKDYVGMSGMVAQSYYEEALTQDLKGDKPKAREYFERANNADRDFDVAACQFARWLQKNADPKEKDRDKEKIKELAKRYMELNPQGECAAELKPIAAQP